ncbi:MAG: protoporphyrinogen oxidase HemJ [Alphaproteobacteria bacterium]|nr:protoporphyrinogen oxidase HemJ [Alphaproteobacteria bacterium]
MYEWIKALHVIAIIAWMAGLLYLPRLYVYHCGAEPGSSLDETLKVMERRLLRAIMNPSMLVSWVLGLWAAYELNAWADGWFHIKLTLVVGLTISHMVMASHRKRFLAGENLKSDRYFRVLNEIPTVLMIAIVILVIVKPF